jgi:hypothetical protein
MTSKSSQVIAKTDDPGTGAAPGMANIEARIVTAIYDGQAAADAGRRALIEDGFDDSVIVVSAQPAGTAPEYDASLTQARGGLHSGVIIGALIGLVLGIVVMLIPSLRAILPVSPIVGIIFAAIIGAALGSLVGSFGGLGTKTARAQRVEQATRIGGTTVAVRVADAEQAAQAEQALRRTNPREVSGFQESL